jgi:hypothetical protein
MYKNKLIIETDRKRKFVGILYILFAWLDLLTVNYSQPFQNKWFPVACTLFFFSTIYTASIYIILSIPNSLNTSRADNFYSFIDENRYLQHPF